MNDIVSTIRFVTLVAFLVLCFLGGGGSREDILSLLYVRPAAVICLGVLLATPGRIDFATIRVPFWLLVGFALWMAVQLVPLPPQIWTALPGRELLAEGARVLGVAQPWRPISMTPDLTLNSLAAMVVPFTALVGYAVLEQRHREALVIVFASGALASALFGLVQLSAGADSALFTYRITNNGSAVGLFANRNHQAVLLALALPMLAVLAAGAGGDRQARLVKRGSATAIAVSLLLVLLVVGSRAGLVLGGVAASWAVFHYLELRRSARGHSGSQRRSLLVALGATAVVGAGLVFFAFARAQSLQRLLGVDLQGEQRLQQLPYVARMAWDYFPFGAGFGAFDATYRIHEPLDLLSTRYLNHAHNDLLELVITGGAPAALLLLAFLIWWGWRSALAFRTGGAHAVLGAMTVMFLLLASLVDYPLRTPIFAALLAVACGWLGGGRSAAKG